METGLSMGNAIQYHAEILINAEAIVSFDKHFDDLMIPRKEPKDLIKPES